MDTNGREVMSVEETNVVEVFVVVSDKRDVCGKDMDQTAEDYW